LLEKPQLCGEANEDKLAAMVSGFSLSTEKKDLKQRMEDRNNGKGMT
jgi:hypothetical protein